MKKVIVFLFLVMVLLGSCSTKQKFAGTWIGDDGELWIFTGDGKLIVEGERARYSTAGKQMSISIDGDTVIFDFSISSDGKTLLLSSAWEGSYALTKIISNPIKLIENRWVNGSITSNSRAVVYSFNAVSGKTYYIWTNDDSEGDGSKSLDIVFTVFDENDGYDDDDDCWTDPCRFTASANGLVTIVVSPYDEDESGTFAIAYSTSRTRP
jgi:hypothetical protein